MHGDTVTGSGGNQGTGPATDLAPTAGTVHVSRGKEKGSPIFSQETDRLSQEKLTALKG